MGTQEPHGAPVSVLVVMLAQVLPDAVDGLHALVQFGSEYLYS